MPALLGYALANNHLPTPLAGQARAVLAGLRHSGQLAPTARVALGSQLCLTETHQGRGLMPLLLGQLLHQLAPHYEYLCAVVHRLNERSLHFHRRQGYQVVAHDAERLTLLLPIDAGQQRPPPPGLQVRPGTSADAPAARALNEQWLRRNRAGQLASGFLTTLYTAAEFAQLSAAGEVAVLEETMAPA